MRKYLFSFIMLIMVCCLTLTGCNLFERDNAAYLAQVVAKTKGECAIEVTMQDVVNGYNNWGYKYFQNSNVDKEQATRQIIDDCIDRKLLINYFDAKYQLDDSEIRKVTQDVYDSINSQIENLENTIRIEWKWDSSSGDTNSDGANEIDENSIYTPYESVFKQDDSGNIVYASDYEDETEYPESVSDKFEFTSIGSLADADDDNKKLFKEAKNRYFNNLKDEFEERGITNKNGEELLQLEVNRLKSLSLENAKILKLQHIYNSNWKNSKGENYQTGLNNTLDKIYEAFKNKYNEQKQLYSNSANIDKYKEAITNSSRTTPIYYHPETDVKYFTVTHLLIKFDDETTNKLKKAEELIGDGNTQEDYDKLLETSYKELTVQAINTTTGKPDGNPKSAFAIYNEIPKTSDGVITNLEDFRDIQFKYTYKYTNEDGKEIELGDYAVNSASYDYVIPATGDSPMVESFTKTARELYNNGKGVVGAVSEPIKSEFGYHIIVYTGEVKNFLSDVSNKQVVLDTLINTQLKADRNKTYLDLVYESISSELEDFDTWVQDIIETERNKLDKIVWYPYRYKKFFKN